jgi:hypothetical protein
VVDGAGFMALPLSALVWLAALGTGVALLAGSPARAGAEWLPAEGRLRLPDSWMPMLLILGIFSLRYAANVGMAMNPGWRSAPELLLPLALFYGGLSGLFWAPAGAAEVDPCPCCCHPTLVVAAVLVIVAIAIASVSQTHSWQAPSAGRSKPRSR